MCYANYIPLREGDLMTDKQLNKDKATLKKLRALLNKGEFKKVNSTFISEIKEAVNSNIGLINCYLTDDNAQLKRLAKQDGLR
jgi:hypothetical protein